MLCHLQKIHEQAGLARLRSSEIVPTSPSKPSQCLLQQVGGLVLQRPPSHFPLQHPRYTNLLQLLSFLFSTNIYVMQNMANAYFSTKAYPKLRAVLYHTLSSNRNKYSGR